MTQKPLADQVYDIVRVARLYYEDNLPQEQIAKTIGRSRPTVSRMLAAAREQGIVAIDIRAPLQRMAEMEEDLKTRLGLTECRVVAAPRNEPLSIDHLGPVSAEYVHGLLEDGMTVGVSSGRALASTARYLEPRRGIHLEVVQIIGAMASDDPVFDTPDIARAIARAYDVPCHYLHAPLVVDDVQTRNVLLRDRSLAHTLQLAHNADVALVGIGTLDLRDRGPLLQGQLSAKEVALIRTAGGVGHICGEHYDAAGRRLDLDLNDRVVGIGLSRLQRIQAVVAVAGGATKAPAILAAARGKFIDTLITDDRAANRLLQLLGS